MALNNSHTRSCEIPLSVGACFPVALSGPFHTELVTTRVLGTCQVCNTLGCVLRCEPTPVINGRHAKLF